MPLTISEFFREACFFLGKFCFSQLNVWLDPFWVQHSNCIVNEMIFIQKNIWPFKSGSVLMNFQRPPIFWSIIFFKTLKFLFNMWYVMCVAWCVMFQAWYFVGSMVYEAPKWQSYVHIWQGLLSATIHTHREIQCILYLEFVYKTRIIGWQKVRSF